MSLANLLKKDWLAQVATATPATAATAATAATHEPHSQPPVARVATVAVANSTDSMTARAVGQLTTPMPQALSGDFGASTGPIPRHLLGMKFSGGIRSLDACNDPAPAPDTTEQQDWQTLDRAYQAHHINCPACIAAGKGYGLRCGTGAALWAAYDQTSKPTPVSAKPAPASHSSAEVHTSLLTAATPDEINLMTSRLALFADRGVGDAEKLVDKLLVRDREGVCVGCCAECRHLHGNAHGRWQCGDTKVHTNELAGAWLGAAFVYLNLHHCNSLEKAI